MRTSTLILAAAGAALLAGLAHAQSLTPTQQATLRTASCADVTTGRPAMVSGNAAALRAWLNTASTFIAWRKSVPTNEIGTTVNYVAIASMTTANLDRVNVFYTLNPVSFDPSRSDIRTYMSDIFSGALGGQGQATRDALEAMYRRTANNYERALGSGTGTTATPGTLTLEGQIGESATVALVFQDNGTLYGCP